MKKLKYITKFNYSKSKGYWVRLPEFEHGMFKANNKYQNHNVFFGLHSYRSWAACKAAARIYRDQYLKQNDAMYLLDEKYRKKGAMQNSKRNTSGVIGVSYSVNPKKAGTYYGYKATYMWKGWQYTREFSVGLYGAADAFLKACRERYKYSGMLVVVDESMIPCKPDVPYKVK